MPTTASAIGNDNVVGITGRLAGIVGWTDEQVAALRAGISLGDNKIDALTGLVREAAVSARSVTGTSWTAAQDAGWNDEDDVRRWPRSRCGRPRR